MSAVETAAEGKWIHLIHFGPFYLEEATSVTSFLCSEILSLLEQTCIDEGDKNILDYVSSLTSVSISLKRSPNGKEIKLLPKPISLPIGDSQLTLASVTIHLYSGEPAQIAQTILTPKLTRVLKDTYVPRSFTTSGVQKEQEKRPQFQQL